MPDDHLHGQDLAVREVRRYFRFYSGCQGTIATQEASKLSEVTQMLEKQAPDNFFVVLVCHLPVLDGFD